MIVNEFFSTEAYARLLKTVRKSFIMSLGRSYLFNENTLSTLEFDPINGYRVRDKNNSLWYVNKYATFAPLITNKNISFFVGGSLDYTFAETNLARVADFLQARELKEYTGQVFNEIVKFLTDEIG